MIKSIPVGLSIYIACFGVASAQTDASFVLDQDWDVSAASNTSKIGARVSRVQATGLGQISLSASAFSSSNSDLSYFDGSASVSRKLLQSELTETFAELGVYLSRYPFPQLDLVNSYAMIGVRLNYHDMGSALFSFRVEEDQSSFIGQNHRLASLDFGVSHNLGLATVTGGTNFSTASYENGEVDTHVSVRGGLSSGFGQNSLALDVSIDDALQSLYVDGAHTRQKVDEFSVALTYLWQVNNKFQVMPRVNWSDQIGETYSRDSLGIGVEFASSF